MKTGRSLTDLAIEIERQQNTKRDFVAPANEIALVKHGAGDFAVRLGRLERGQAFATGEIAHQQLAEFAGIPKVYYDRMRAEMPELLTTNVNTWLAASDQRRMVRTLDGKARAVLSDRYRPLDNFELADSVLPALLEAKLEIVSAEITERRLYIKAVDPKTQRHVPSGFKIGDGSHVGFKIPSGELCPAIQISNSEIGYGTLSVVGGCLDSGCTNLMWRWRDAGLKKYHVGGRADVSDGLYQILSDETKRATDKAVWLQVRDTVKAALSVDAFENYVATLCVAAGEKIDADPVKVVDVTAKRFGLNDGQRVSVLQHLIRGGDLSKFGLANAITSAANDQDDYDVATALEATGGKVIELARSEWRTISEGTFAKAA